MSKGNMKILYFGAIFKAFRAWIVCHGHVQYIYIWFILFIFSSCKIVNETLVRPICFTVVNKVVTEVRLRKDFYKSRL